MMKTFLTSAAIAALIFAAADVHAQGTAPDAASAQSVSAERAKDIIAVLSGDMAAEDVFAASFLSAVSAEQLEQLTQQLSDQFGPVIGLDSVEDRGGGRAQIAIRFQKAIGRGPMTLDEDGKVAGLLLNAFEPIDDTPEKVLADLEALPGTVSVLFTPLGDGAEPLLALNADKQMAVGSTFKLYVLAALARRIEAGLAGWDQTIRLTERSFPSGMMQNWPEQSPVTLNTLATMMISISDNTATDQLIEFLGRSVVEEEVSLSEHSDPDKMNPFLTTLELFTLKGDTQRGAHYAASAEAAQYDILKDLKEEFAGNRDLITPPTFSQPTQIDTLEWFASANDVGNLMRRIAALKEPSARNIMAVNPSMSGPDRKRWRYVGYKGGSEPGVLNLTWLLQDQEDAWHTLTVSWNDPDAPLDDSTLELLAVRILALKQP